MRKVIATALAGVCCLAFPSKGTGTMLSSWYGPGFHGGQTANGERFDMYGATAAHRHLPFGTELRVCYEGCVDVQVNDRGPFVGPRELDLSYGAARQIGLINVGVANVDVKILS